MDGHNYSKPNLFPDAAEFNMFMAIFCVWNFRLYLAILYFAIMSVLDRDALTRFGTRECLVLIDKIIYF